MGIVVLDVPSKMLPRSGTPGGWGMGCDIVGEASRTSFRLPQAVMDPVLVTRLTKNVKKI